MNKQRTALLIGMKQQYRHVNCCKKVGLDEAPNMLITNIGVGKQQLVEIAKALSKEVKLLIFR
ncbi:hypothetical protein GCM10020331_099630 [Ectobacillus funiculus]